MAVLETQVRGERIARANSLAAQPEQRDGLDERTVFAAFYTADPPTGGASAVTFHLARHWPGQRLILQLGKEPLRREIAPGLESLTLRQAGSGQRFRKFVQLARWIREMVSAAAEFRADTIVLEGASWSLYHWWLASRIRRDLPAVRVIYHGHNVEYDLRRQKHSWPIAHVTRLAEARILAVADVVTAVSEVDACRMADLYGVTPVLLPNGVDLAWLRQLAPGAVEAARAAYGLADQTVLFMGDYIYRPNGEAIDFLVNQIFPAVVERVPAAHLLIVGGEVPYRRPWLTAPGVLPAEELPAVIAGATVSVAPIFSGSGTRLKILEALGAGIPVVATAKGAEGLALGGCADFTLAETADQFAAALCTVFAQAREAGPKECPPAIAAYDWKSIVSTTRRLIR